MKRKILYNHNAKAKIRKRYRTKNPNNKNSQNLLHQKIIWLEKIISIYFSKYELEKNRNYKIEYDYGNLEYKLK